MSIVPIIAGFWADRFGERKQIEYTKKREKTILIIQDGQDIRDLARKSNQGERHGPDNGKKKTTLNNNTVNFMKFIEF